MRSMVEGLRASALLPIIPETAIPRMELAPLAPLHHPSGGPPPLQMQGRNLPNSSPGFPGEGDHAPAWWRGCAKRIPARSA